MKKIVNIKFEWNHEIKKKEEKAKTFDPTKTTINVGDIVCYEGTSLRSKLIRIITNSPFSHIGIIFHNKNYIIHSIGYKGVCVDKIQYPYILVKHSRPWTMDNLQKCLKVLPAGYDITSALFIHKMSIPDKSLESKQSFTCSDLVSFIFDLPLKMSPYSLAKYFLEQENGNAFLVEN
jgi:hypothetical protein